MDTQPQRPAKEKGIARENEKKDSFTSQYNSLLVRYPLIINGMQAAIMAGFGGFLSQIIAGVQQFDFNEIQIMMVINFAYHTPILIWFSSVLAKSKMNLMIKVIVDQLFFSPVFTSGIVAVRLLLKGTELSTIPMEVINVVPGAMLYSWLFWVPAKTFILAYVPVMYQFVVNNVFALVWNIIFAAILSAK